MKAKIINSGSLDFIKGGLNREINNLNIESSQFQKELSALMDRTKPNDAQFKKIVDLDCTCQIERRCKREFLNLLESHTEEIEI